MNSIERLKQQHRLHKDDLKDANIKITLFLTSFYVCFPWLHSVNKFTAYAQIR